jgi:hypothetical protein
VAPHPVRLALGVLLGLLVLAPAASAQGARYRIEGAGPEGRCEGSAFIAPEPGGPLTVTLKTRDAAGEERRARAEVVRAGVFLAFDVRASRGVIVEPALSARARRLGSGALEVAYRDARGEVVRRETWRRDEDVTIPLQVVALTGEPGRFPGVSAEQAAAAQDAILAQLDLVFGPCRVRFEAVSAPALLPGAGFDADQDGRLVREEAATVRGALEERELKRPGRVVLVVTAAAFVGRGCRGWTLGDAPPTPHSLGDVNDNFSLVGARFLDGHHTAAHEVGHQLGLDDLTPQNRGLLERRDRDDQLMESGGHGVFVDPAFMRVLRGNVRWPDHGLDGRRQGLTGIFAD